MQLSREYDCKLSPMSPPRESSYGPQIHLCSVANFPSGGTIVFAPPLLMTQQRLHTSPTGFFHVWFKEWSITYCQGERLAPLGGL